MKYALIGCMVLARDIGYCISQNENTIHSFWLEQGLHDTPSKLKEQIQELIEKIETLNETLPDGRKFDAILLAYGLCSNGVVGLKSNKLKIIIPRCDDCMALFLGSQEKYLEIFNTYKGIYWFNKPWVENAFIPSKKNYELMYQDYLKYYDEDNAEYLIEVETSFTKNYKNAFFIKSAIYNDKEAEQEIRENAEYFGWTFNLIKSDKTFLNDLISGKHDDRFLICEVGQTTQADYDGKKITAF